MINLPGNQRDDAVSRGGGAKVTKQRAEILLSRSGGRGAEGKGITRGRGCCAWTWLIICGKFNAQSLHNLFA